MSEEMDHLALIGDPRTRAKEMLRPCAKCGHARCDHEHGHTDSTWCAIDMGGEQSDPCGCDGYVATKDGQ